jgi:hypothetical protein
MIGSAEEFARLRGSDSPEEQSRAGTEEASADVWFSVIERFPELREWVAHNKTVPLEVLELLARDPSRSVRSTVAGKRKLSYELQLALAKDPDSSVRARLAWNAKCKTDVLHTLAADEEPFVREAATQRLLKKSDAL